MRRGYLWVGYNVIRDEVKGNEALMGNEGNEKVEKMEMKNQGY